MRKHSICRKFRNLNFSKQVGYPFLPPQSTSCRFVDHQHPQSSSLVFACCFISYVMMPPMIMPPCYLYFLYNNASCCNDQILCQIKSSDSYIGSNSQGQVGRSLFLKKLQINSYKLSHSEASGLGNLAELWASVEEQ